MVLAPATMIGELRQYAVAFGDVTLIAAEITDGSALDVYRASIARSYAKLFAPAPVDGDAELLAETEIIDLKDMLTPDEQAEVSELMQQHHAHKPRRDAGASS